MIEGVREWMELINNATPWAKFIYIIVFVSPVVLIGCSYWIDRAEKK